MEGCRSIVSDDEEVFACCRKCREIGAVQVLFLRTDRILLAELIDAFQGIEGTVNPNVGLCGSLLDEREVSATWHFLSAIGVDDLERFLFRVCHVSVLVVLRPESALVHAYRTPVIDIQGVEVATVAAGTRPVDIGKCFATCRNRGVNAQ